MNVTIKTWNVFGAVLQRFDSNWWIWVVFYFYRGVAGVHVRFIRKKKHFFGYIETLQWLKKSTRKVRFISPEKIKKVGSHESTHYELYINIGAYLKSVFLKFIWLLEENCEMKGFRV